MSPAIRRSLKLEHLENRQLMAGDVTAVLVGGVLTITGDRHANHIDITNDGGNIEITGISTRIFDRTPPHTNPAPRWNAVFANVTDIVINMKEGNDIVDVAGITISGGLTIVTQNGNDGVTIGDSSLSTDPTIVGALNINTGLNSDVVQIANLHVLGNALIVADKGNDAVTLERDATSNTPITGSPIGFANTGITVDGSLTINLGEGNDTLDMDEVKVLQALSMSDPNGNDHATLNRVDAVFATLSMAGIGLGGDNDDVSIQNSKFTQLTVLLGRGNDRLTVGQTSVTGQAMFDGNIGRDTYVNLGDNSLLHLRKLGF